MRSICIAAGIALAGLSASSASAQWRGQDSSLSWRYERAINQTQRECARALRWADTRREYNRISWRCRERLEDLRREYRRELRRDRRGGWDDDPRWRGRDRDDDDDDDD